MFTGFPRISKDRLSIALCVCAMMLIALGPAFFAWGYSIDGYVMCSAPPEWWGRDAHVYLGDGRFGRAIIFAALHSLGVIDCYAPTLYGFASIILLLASLLAVLDAWRVESVVGGILIGGVLLTHPYHAEIFSFREGSLYFSLAIFLASVSARAVARSNSGVRGLSIAIAVMAIALSIYQLAINYAILILLFSVCEKRLFTSDEHAGHSLAKARNSDLARFATFTIASAAVYLLANKFSLAITGEPPGARTSLLDRNGILPRVYELKGLYEKLLIGGDAILPALVKYLLLALPLLAMLFSVRPLSETPLTPNGALRRFGLVTITCLGGLVAVLGVQLPLQNVTPVPRTLSAVSVFFAGTLMLVIKLRPGTFHRFLVAPVVMMVIVFAGNANHVLVDQLRLNERDRGKAHRIFSALERHPAYASMKKLVVVGGQWNYSAPMATAFGDLNVSAFGVSWARMEIVQEVSGQRFEWVTPEDKSRAAAHCENAPKWPDAKSVEVIGDLGVVCLSERANP